MCAVRRQRPLPSHRGTGAVQYVRRDVWGVAIRVAARRNLSAGVRALDPGAETLDHRSYRAPVLGMTPNVAPLRR